MSEEFDVEKDRTLNPLTDALRSISQIEEEEIDHEFTDEIVCPYCGEVHSDSQEEANGGKMDCDECEKEFEFWRDISVSYTTKKVEH